MRGKPTLVAELWTNLNFCEKNFRHWMSNHEIHKNIVPQKFGAIRYIITTNHRWRNFRCKKFWSTAISDEN